MITGQSFHDVLIIFNDGERVEKSAITRVDRAEGFLSLYEQQSDYADEKHRGSWPVANIRVYYTRKMFPNDMRGKEEWPE